MKPKTLLVSGIDGVVRDLYGSLFEFYVQIYPNKKRTMDGFYRTLITPLSRPGKNPYLRFLDEIQKRGESVKEIYKKATANWELLNFYKEISSSVDVVFVSKQPVSSLAEITRQWITDKLRIIGFPKRKVVIDVNTEHKEIPKNILEHNKYNRFVIVDDDMPSMSNVAFEITVYFHKECEVIDYMINRDGIFTIESYFKKKEIMTKKVNYSALKEVFF